MILSADYKIMFAVFFLTIFCCVSKILPCLELWSAQTAEWHSWSHCVIQRITEMTLSNHFKVKCVVVGLFLRNKAI